MCGATLEVWTGVYWERLFFHNHKALAETVILSFEHEFDEISLFYYQTHFLSDIKLQTVVILGTFSASSQHPLAVIYCHMLVALYWTTFVENRCYGDGDRRGRRIPYLDAIFRQYQISHTIFLTNRFSLFWLWLSLILLVNAMFCNVFYDICSVILKNIEVSEEISLRCSFYNRPLWRPPKPVKWLVFM